MKDAKQARLALYELLEKWAREHKVDNPQNEFTTDIVCYVFEDMLGISRDEYEHN